MTPRRPRGRPGSGRGSSSSRGGGRKFEDAYEWSGANGGGRGSSRLSSPSSGRSSVSRTLLTREANGAAPRMETYVPSGPRFGGPPRAQRSAEELSLMRQILHDDQEAFEWLKSDRVVSKLLLPIMKGMDRKTDIERSERFGNYADGFSGADEPVVFAVNQSIDEVAVSLSLLNETLRNPSKTVTLEMQHEYYLMFSVCYTTVTQHALPQIWLTLIRECLVSASLIALRSGDAHSLLACITDYIREAEDSNVLLVMQQVLFQVIDNDEDGSRLFGTAHGILDVQMELLEYRDDEPTAISVLKIIALITLRHPQAFKTRFRDLMDLFFGWYVGATPDERVFKAAVSAFAMFREKFRQESDFAMKMVGQFSADIEALGTEFRGKEIESKEARTSRRTFIALVELISLVLHAVGFRVNNPPRNSDNQLRNTMKAIVSTFLKYYNQLSSPAESGVTLASRMNSALVIVLQSFGTETAPISSQLYLHIRMQQALCLKIKDVFSLQPSLVRSFFTLLDAIIGAFGLLLPLDVAKDLLGPKSLFAEAWADPAYSSTVEKTVKAALKMGSAAVREMVIRNMLAEYSRALNHLMGKTPEGTNKRQSSPVPLRRALTPSLFGDVEAKTAVVNEDDVWLAPDGSEDPPEMNNVSGFTGKEVEGGERNKVGVFLDFVEETFSTAVKQKGEYNQGILLEKEVVDVFYEDGIRKLTSMGFSSHPELAYGHLKTGTTIWMKKAPSLVVKDLMTTGNSFGGLTPADKQYITDTLKCLDAALREKESMLQEASLRWAWEVIQTLNSLTTDLKQLGLSGGYTKLVTPLLAVAFGSCDAGISKRSLELVRSTTFQTKFPENSLIISAAVHATRSSIVEQRELAEALLLQTSLQNIIRPLKDGRKSLSVVLPFDRNTRKWILELFHSFGGSASSLFAPFLRLLVDGTRDSSRVSESAVVYATCGNRQWSDMVASNSSLAFACIANVIAGSFIDSDGFGFLSEVGNAVMLLQAVVGMHFPSTKDQKGLLQLYTALKDESMDLSDEVDTMKKFLVEQANEESTENEPNQPTKSPLEKRRIYTRSAGITAADVLNPALSSKERGLILDRIYVFAECLEKKLEAVAYGSANHFSSLRDEDLERYAALVKDRYSNVETVDGTLKSLRTVMLRIVLERKDAAGIVRLGYPAIMDVLQSGEAPQGIQTEKLAQSVLLALVELRAADSIRHLHKTQAASDYYIGISDDAFNMAIAMADERWSSALEETWSLKESENAFDKLELELAMDCYATLGDWSALSNVLANAEEKTREQTDLLYLLNMKTESFISTNDATNRISKLLSSRPNMTSHIAEMLMMSKTAHQRVLAEAPRLLKQELLADGRVNLPKLRADLAVSYHAVSRALIGASEEVQAFRLGDDISFVEDLDIGSRRVLQQSLVAGGKDSPLATGLNMSIAKFGCRTGNERIVKQSLMNAFGNEEDSIPAVLLRAVEQSVSPAERALVRIGVKGLLATAAESSVNTLGILHANIGHCVGSSSTQHLVEAAKSLKLIEEIHESNTGGDSENLLPQTKLAIENLYMVHGFPSGMFMDTHPSMFFVRPETLDSGTLRELAYMVHCMEGTYPKPALQFGDWCFDQAVELIEANAMLKPEDILGLVAEGRPELDFSNLEESSIRKIFGAFIESVPMDLTQQDGFNPKGPTLSDALESLLSDHQEVYSSPEVLAVVEYLQHLCGCIRDLFIHSTHLYFVYLRNPQSVHRNAAVVLRLLKLLIAYPSEVGPIWMAEISGSNLTCLLDFVPQFLSALQYDRQEIRDALVMSISLMLHHAPAQLFYPLAVMRLSATDSAAGLADIRGYPLCTDAARKSILDGLHQLTAHLPEQLAKRLSDAEDFAREIQRISLLREERALNWLRSNQASLKKQIRAAIMSSRSGVQDTPAELDDDNEESAMTGSPASQADLNGSLPENVMADEDANQKPDLKESDTLQNVTVPEANRKQAGSDGRNAEQVQYLNFPVYDKAEANKTLNLESFKSAMKAVMDDLYAFLKFCEEPAESEMETDFRNSFVPRLQDAVHSILNPDPKVPFDEEVLWAPMEAIMKDMEAAHAAVRANGLRARNACVMQHLLADRASLPMPGHTAMQGKEDIVVVDMEDQIVVLPTKTKPKKICFRGSDGQRYTYLCKGLEDLNQDNRIMQFLSVTNRFLDKALKHTQHKARIRTYSVIPFGARSGLIQWVDGATSLLSLYRCHLERENLLGRQLMPIKDDFVANATQAKEAEDRTRQPATGFRVTEQELQEIYQEVRDVKYEGKAGKEDESVEKDDEKVGDGENEDNDPTEDWVDDEEQFSPTEFVNKYYETFLTKGKGELKRIIKPVPKNLRSHPNIQDLHFAYVLKSLREDPSFDWNKLKRSGSSVVKKVGLEHLRNAFKDLIAATPNSLLEREMRLLSLSSEDWWRCHRNYINSLAVTSMVGYVLGLGDRHPDNILFDYETGDVIHVDYNVAFERGLRLSVPERVPFRLTQNLVNALGCEGIDGSFRTLSVKTMESLRANSNSLASLLSCYPNDPMIDWTTQDRSEKGADQERRVTKAQIRASKLMTRVTEKLKGFEKRNTAEVSVSDQVGDKIAEAVDVDNLARMFEGWISWL